MAKESNITVVKIGGSILGSGDTTIADIVDLQKQGKHIIVVHGGGKLVTDWLKIQGLSANFVRGERVTDKPALDVATAVLAGLVNKEIVAAINCCGGRAVGISGVDGGLIQGGIRDVEMGFVGNITRVDVTVLETLLQSGFVPVVATVGLNTQVSNGAPQILNINADVVAGDIAAVIGAARLIFFTDVDGIHDASGQVMSYLSSLEAADLINSGVASGGMIPKIKACLKALNGHTATCVIDGRQPHALLDHIAGKTSGTVIK